MMPILAAAPAWLLTITMLVVIEGLLSVDNALGVASLAKDLPHRERALAMRIGFIGAYLFRIIAIIFVSWISATPWVMWAGAGYLIYLMCDKVPNASEEEAKEKKADGFWSAVLAIGLMDLSLSVDNVVTSVALAHGDKTLTIIGVGIGIVVLRFLAEYCIKLLQRYPILEKAAFFLVGWVGVLMIVEMGAQYLGYPAYLHPIGLTSEHPHIAEWVKFLGMGLILGTCLLYAEKPVVQSLLKPLILIGAPLMRGFAFALRLPFKPLVVLVKALWPKKA